MTTISEFARRMGRRGGKAKAAKMTPEERREMMERVRAKKKPKTPEQIEAMMKRVRARRKRELAAQPPPKPPKPPRGTVITHNGQTAIVLSPLGEITECQAMRVIRKFRARAYSDGHVITRKGDGWIMYRRGE